MWLAGRQLRALFDGMCFERATPAALGKQGRAMADHSVYLRGGSSGVLLIHGLGGTPAELRNVAKALHAAGHTVLCCQLAGHCGSEEDLLATSWHDWYESAKLALARLESSCRTVAVGGLSMGALLALHLAADHPGRVRGTLLFGPTLFYDGWSVPWYSFLLRLVVWLPIGRNYRFPEQHPYGVKDERTRAAIARLMSRRASAAVGLTHTPGRSIRELWRLCAKLKPKLAHIASPALIVHARDDDTASLRNAYYLQRKLGGRIESLVLDDSYHLVTIDRQRDLANAAAIRFLADIHRGTETATRSAQAA